MLQNSLRYVSALMLVLAALAYAKPLEAQEDVWRLDVSEPVTYWIAEATPESGVTEADRTMARWALDVGRIMWGP